MVFKVIVRNGIIRRSANKSNGELFLACYDPQLVDFGENHTNSIQAWLVIGHDLVYQP